MLFSRNSHACQPLLKLNRINGCTDRVNILKIC